MQIVIAELGLDLTVKEFVEKVRNDPENYFGWEASFFPYKPGLVFASNVLDVSFSRSGEEVLSTFNTTINEKILAKLPTLFKKIPSMKLELVEESVKKSLNAKLEQDVKYIKLSYIKGSSQ